MCLKRVVADRAARRSRSSRAIGDRLATIMVPSADTIAPAIGPPRSSLTTPVMLPRMQADGLPLHWGRCAQAVELQVPPLRSRDQPPCQAPVEPFIAASVIA